MALRRKTFRRRTYKKRGLAPIAKKQVKAIVKSQIPKSIFDVSGATFQTIAIGTSFGSASTTDMTQIPTGTTEGTRSGNRIRIHSIRFAGRIRTTNITNGDVVTLAFLRSDNPTLAAAIVPGDYFQNNAIAFAPVSYEQDDTNIKCIWKKTWVIGPSGNMPSVPVRKTLYFKRPIVVQYTDAGTTGAATEVVKNLIQPFVAAITATTVLDIAYRVTFSNM